MAGGAYHRQRLLLQQHAVTRIHAEEKLRPLRHRRGGGAAEYEAATVPVEVVLGEVALEDATAYPGRPHVVCGGRPLARELEVHRADREDRLGGGAPAMGDPVDQRAPRSLEHDEPVT